MKKKILLIITLLISIFIMNDKVNASTVCNKLVSPYKNVCVYNTFSDGGSRNINIVYLYYNDTDTLIEYSENVFNKLTTGTLLNQNGVSESGLPDEKALKECSNLSVCRANFIPASELSSGCPEHIYLYDYSFQKIGSRDLYYRYFYFYKNRIDDSEVPIYNKNTIKYRTDWIEYYKQEDCNEDNKTNGVDDPCELISDNLIGYINTGLKYIRIIVPILLLVFVVMDLFKAIFSSSEDAMKKAQSKIFKRVIIAVAIFFIPTIVNLILNLTNDIWSNINKCDINIK